MPKIVVDSHGNFVTSENKEAWLEARLNGVTATEAGKIAAGGKQKEKLFQAKLTGNIESLEPNVYMQHGTDREEYILKYVKEKYGAEHNTYLYESNHNPHHLATPDGVSEDYVVEVKASIKSLPELIATYNNQMQWQMYVMDVEKVLFVVETHKNFIPMSTEEAFIVRDDKKIDHLRTQAELFMANLHKARMN